MARDAPRKVELVNEFPHAMLREIYEQPDAIRGRWIYIWTAQTFDGRAFAPLAKWLNPRGEVLIAASGSSRHAGLAAEIILEDLCGLAVDVEYASEYGCRPTANPRQPIAAGDFAVGRNLGHAGRAAVCARIADSRRWRSPMWPAAR